MADDKPDIARWVDEGAKAIGLPIAPEYRDKVILNVERSLAIAQPLLALELDDAADPVAGLPAMSGHPVEGRHASEIARAVDGRPQSRRATSSKRRSRGSRRSNPRSTPSPISSPTGPANARRRSMPAVISVRWRACRSRSRTCSTSRACRRAPARRSTATLPPAARDGALVARLEAAGAILVGALNMGEYAYDFTGENAHYGPSRNPHDPGAHDRRLVGRLGRGGRGGRGAAGAGLRHQRLDPRAVVAVRPVRAEADLRAAEPRRLLPVRRCLDHLGPLARSAEDLALAFDAMQGSDPDDPACTDRAVEPTAADCCSDGIGGLRIAIAGGLFHARRRARSAARR